MDGELRATLARLVDEVGDITGVGSELSECARLIEFVRDALPEGDRRETLTEALIVIDDLLGMT